MKPRVKVKVQFGKPTHPAPTVASERVPRVARLLALAWWLDERIRAGEVESWAAAARGLGVSRARIAQIADLTLLSPAIQRILTERSATSERMLRAVVPEVDWCSQERKLRKFTEDS